MKTPLQIVQNYLMIYHDGYFLYIMCVAQLVCRQYLHTIQQIAVMFQHIQSQEFYGHLSVGFVYLNSLKQLKNESHNNLTTAILD